MTVAECEIPNSGNSWKLESRVHRKVQAQVRGGAGGKGLKGTSLAAYSTSFVRITPIGQECSLVYSDDLFFSSISIPSLAYCIYAF